MENSKYQMALADTTQMYEMKITELTKQLEDEHTRSEGAQERLDLANMLLADYQNSAQVKLLPQMKCQMIFCFFFSLNISLESNCFNSIIFSYLFPS